ncbi:MAG: NfeD family protein [Candidatus Rokubacteria bacterium]|nr:NfeD family protein [Candidatus Rokubacteria bacterium]
MAWWLWILMGLALLGLEMATPGGFYLLFFGVGALVVGATVGVEVGGPVWVQWLLFSAVSVVSLLLFRGPLLARLKGRERDVAMDTLEGEVATLMDDLSPGAVGKAELRGTTWTAQNGDDRPLSRGQRCRVARVEGLTLWVRAE